MYKLKEHTGNTIAIGDIFVSKQEAHSSQSPRGDLLHICFSDAALDLLFSKRSKMKASSIVERIYSLPSYILQPDIEEPFRYSPDTHCFWFLTTFIEKEDFVFLCEEERPSFFCSRFGILTDIPRQTWKLGIDFDQHRRNAIDELLQYRIPRERVKKLHKEYKGDGR